MTAPQNPYAEIGPALPPAWQVIERAKEIEALARRAAEFARPGPQQDLHVALRQFAAINQLTSEGDPHG
jgi:hypothetical protein